MALTGLPALAALTAYQAGPVFAVVGAFTLFVLHSDSNPTNRRLELFGSNRMGAMKLPFLSLGASVMI